MNGFSPEVDVRVLLRADHEHALRLARGLAAIASSERRAVLSLLASALSVHARAEERAVYVPLSERRMGLFAHEGAVEHDLVATLLRELTLCRRTDGAEWTAAATVMTELLEQHLEGEHDALFVALGRSFSAAELRLMGGSFLEIKRRLLERDASPASQRHAPHAVAELAGV